MREKRNGLRPCTVKGNGFSIENAYFHLFGLSGDCTDGIGTVALIEDANGKVHEVGAWEVKFEDVE